MSLARKSFPLAIWAAIYFFSFLIHEMGHAPVEEAIAAGVEQSKRDTEKPESGVGEGEEENVKEGKIGGWGDKERGRGGVEGREAGVGGLWSFA